MVNDDMLTICLTTGLNSKPKDRPKEFKTGTPYTTRKLQKQ